MPMDLTEVAGATAAHVQFSLCVIEPTKPSGQIGDRSSATPTFPVSRSCSKAECAHFLPDSNCSRRALGPGCGGEQNLIQRWMISCGHAVAAQRMTGWLRKVSRIGRFGADIGAPIMQTRCRISRVNGAAPSFQMPPPVFCDFAGLNTCSRFDLWQSHRKIGS